MAVAVYRVPEPLAASCSTAVKKDRRRAVAWQQGIREDQTFFRYDVEIAPYVVEFLALRRTHGAAENPAGTQIDLARGNRPGTWHKPMPDMLGCRPRLPDEIDRHINIAFKHEIELRIGS